MQDPRFNMRKGASQELAPSGLGNQVSFEFNLAYRWHSAISERDEKWTEDVYTELLGKPAEEVSLPELMAGLGKWQRELPRDPSERTFAHLKRQEDGRFKDEDLVKILTESIEEVAGRDRSRQREHVLTAFQVPSAHGMSQKRFVLWKYSVCSRPENGVAVPSTSSGNSSA
jgi:linoleate 10R-lipoxygenase